MRKWIISVLLLLVQVPFLYGQIKHHTADYYFRQGARFYIAPNANNDSLAKISIAYYAKSVKADKRFWRSYRNRASLYAYFHDYNKAIADLTQAIKYCQQSETFYLYADRGIIYYQTGNYAKAVADINLAIPIEANPSTLYLYRAKCYWKSGWKEKACRDYDKAIKLDSNLIKEKEFLNCN